MICQPGSLLELTSTVRDANGVFVFAARVDGVDVHTGAVGPVWLAVHPFTSAAEVTTGPGVTASCATVPTTTTATVAPLSTVSARQTLAFTGFDPTAVLVGLALVAAGVAALRRARCSPQP